MALMSKQSYDPAQVQKLADLVRLYREKGQPFDYEIMVDDLKVVRRTNDPEMFFLFENFVTADTRHVEVIFYNGSSNVNERRMFTFIDEPQEKGLSGTEIDSRIQEQVERQKKEWEYGLLRQENKELKEEVEELEKEVERLEKEKDEWVNSQSPFKGILGEVGSSFVESFLRRNPAIVKSLPGGEALSGLLDQQTKTTSVVDETEVTFKPSEKPTLSDADQAALVFVAQLKEQFSQAEFDQVLLILQALADDKSKIMLVLKQVNTKQL